MNDNRAKHEEWVDQQTARKSPKWGEAVAFLRETLTPDVKAQVREAIAADHETWYGPLHFFWGMAIRNLLRQHGFAEQSWPVLNLDNIYVPLVEEAVLEDDND